MTACGRRSCCRPPRGRGNAAIARETGAHLDTVLTWRARFADGGIPALADRRRCGRPRRFTLVQVAEVKGPGLPTARRDRHPAVALVMPGTGTRRPPHRRLDLRLHRPLLAAGCATTHSSPGSTSHGSSSGTRPSRPRPPACWTCTPASGTASRSARTST
ncbi:helix-turn-helix domain-containing protein [Streptomyces luteogriseus]|uniref:helix-turn-helix domain-containing protein n=1 Tax=Streptomyces luteogriseus TaxID=68233 RepID=UPI0037A58023